MIASTIDQIRAYCPESLYGTSNLWLFSGSYHDFMVLNREFYDGMPGFFSERMLPIPASSLAKSPRLLRVVLWLVSSDVSCCEDEGTARSTTGY